MILPLVAVLLQAAQTPVGASSPDAKPVRVWLGSSSPLSRGSAVRVYVAAGQDGNLVVLHRSTEGHIDVLFPGHPTDDPFVSVGTYEIRGPSNRAALVVAEPDGTGMILAALSADPLRFNEFVRLASWNPDALVPTWNATDPEGVLSDLVQRMLGDGSFNYDLVTYTVAPPVYAQQDTGAVRDSAATYATYPPCAGCSDIGQEFIVVGPGACAEFFDACFGGRRFRRHEALCGGFSPCAEPPTHGIAYVGPRAVGASVAPSVGATSPSRSLLRPRVHAVPSSAPIGPRGRGGPTPSAPPMGAPPVRVIPLVPGRRPGRDGEPQVAIATRGVGSRGNQGSGRVTAALSDAPISHVRFTLVSAPVGEEPRAAVAHGAAPLVPVARGGNGWSGGGGGGVALARGAAPPAVVRSGVEARSSPAQAAARTRLGTTPWVGAARAQGRSVPLQGVARQGAGSGTRAGSVQVAGRGAVGGGSVRAR